jgi:hypothetical protein
MQQNEDLVAVVRSGFIAKGTNLAVYCRENELNRGAVYRVLRFERNGKKAQELRKRLIEASTAQAITTEG